MANIGVRRFLVLGEGKKVPLGLLRMEQELELRMRALVDYGPDFLSSAFDKAQLSRTASKSGFAPLGPSST